MKPKNYEVLMDIYMGVLNAPAIQFTTEDFGMCQITFSLLEDRITPYNLSNCIVRMVINGQQQDCTISDANNGKAEIVLLQSMFTEVGHVFAELQIYDATNQTMRLTTPTFKYTVRKSLMDDNTVQADANYSILQQMILNVSNADKVSSEALKLSKEAKAICDDLVPKANTAAQNAQTALDRAESVVTQEELAQKVTLDGNDTKFDFIKNKVVQDGLSYVSGYIDKKTNTMATLGRDFTICATIGATVSVDNQYYFGNYQSSTGMYLFYNNDMLKLVIDGTALNIKKLRLGELYNIVIRCFGGACSVLFDGVVYHHQTKYVANGNNVYLGAFGANGNYVGGLFNGITIHSRNLDSNEIQHILSVLNNQPSIKELHTTNVEGKTSILKLGSNSTHVEMQTGRTLEEEYTSLLGRFGKEIDSPDGSAVQVDNGLSGKVLKMSIKGQTVKNYVETNTEKVIRAGGATSAKYKFSNIEVGKTYTLSFELFDSTDESSSIMFSLNNGNTNFSTVKCSNGIKTIEITPESQNLKTELWFYFQNTNTNTAKIRNVMIVDSSNKNIVTSYIPFGLSSTEAIISNNGQQYPIYATEEDKANKKVISLGGLGDVQDTLEILDDGSGVYTHSLYDYKCTGDEYLSVLATQTSNTFGVLISPVVRFKNGIATCDKLNKNTSYQADEIGFSFAGTGKDELVIRFDKTQISTVEQAKLWLKTNTPTFKGARLTPTVTHIPKEIVPAILTHNQTNILEVGGKVKASSFKVTLPVDAIGELRAEINEIKKQLGAVAALQLGQIN